MTLEASLLIITSSALQNSAELFQNFRLRFCVFLIGRFLVVQFQCYDSSSILKLLLFHQYPMKLVKTVLLVTCLLSVLNPVAAQKSATTTVFKVDYEKFTLGNGLQVVFHIDRSDPVVAVALTAHVGSAREKAGARERKGSCKE